MLLKNPTTQQPLNQQTDQFTLQPGPVKTEDSALTLVLNDTHRAERFIMARLWMSEWRVAKALYEAPIKQEFWRDTLVPRASNAYPLCKQHVSANLDQTMPALFPEDPPFMFNPNPDISRQVSRAWEEVLGRQLKQIQFKSKIRLIEKDKLIFGTGIAHWGWESFQRKTTVYVRETQPVSVIDVMGRRNFIHTKESDDLTAVDSMQTISRPFFDRMEINHVLVSPGLREPDIRKAAYVIKRDYLTIRDINRLRDFKGYDIPSEDVLKALAAPPAEEAASSAVENEATAYPAQGHRPLPRYIDESEDPLEHKLEVLEHWTSDRVIVVLQRKTVIRNEVNDFGVVPFLSTFWDDIPGTFYGFGIPRRIGSIQIHIQGLRNLRLDDVNLNLQNVWLEKRGANITGQPLKLYPGSRLKLDDTKEGLVPLIKQPVLNEAYKEEAVLKADAESTTGSNELLIQGALPQSGRTSLGRTATGASALGGAASSHVQASADVSIDQVILPAIQAILHMDREMLDPADLRKMVGKTLWKSLEADHSGDLLLDMFNDSNDLELKTWAGANLTAKKNLAASLPLEMQMYQAPAVQQGLADAGYKVNWVELSRRMEQVTGWKSPDDIIVPMTPQDLQRKMATSPIAVKGQLDQQRIAQLQRGKAELSAQEHQQRLAEQDSKGMAGAGQEIITRAIERAAQREEIPQISGTF